MSLRSSAEVIVDANKTKILFFLPITILARYPLCRYCAIRSRTVEIADHSDEEADNADREGEIGVVNQRIAHIHLQHIQLDRTVSVSIHHRHSLYTRRTNSDTLLMVERPCLLYASYLPFWFTRVSFSLSDVVRLCQQVLFFLCELIVG